jgi:serine/threonine protein kinase
LLTDLTVSLSSATCLRDEDTSLLPFDTRPTGSPYWMAPEVLNRARSDSSKADIWSFGVTVIEMLLGYTPHSDLAPMRAFLSIAKEGIPSLPPALERYSEHLRDFVRQCTTFEAEKRPSAKELLSHPFLSLACPVAELARFVRKKKTESEP